MRVGFEDLQAFGLRAKFSIGFAGFGLVGPESPALRNDSTIQHRPGSGLRNCLEGMGT